MTLQQLVPSLDLCQKLKAAGFPQSAAMVWVKRMQGFIRGGGWGIDEGGIAYNVPFSPTGGYANEVILNSGANNDLDTVFCSAPTAEEILAELPWALRPWLPEVYSASLQVRKTPDGFRVAWSTWNNGGEVPCNDDDKHYEKESDAAAQAYLWWKAQP